MLCRTPLKLGLSVAVVVVFAAGACTNNFDLFNPGGVNDASVDVSVDATVGPEGSGPDSGGPDGGGPDAQPDSGPVDARIIDTGVDSPTCSGKAGCLSDASACGTTCANTRTTCRMGCQNGNPGDPCRAKCDSDRDACYAACVTTCNNCLQTAGCPSGTACQDAMP